MWSFQPCKGSFQFNALHDSKKRVRALTPATRGRATGRAAQGRARASCPPRSAPRAPPARPRRSRRPAAVTPSSPSAQSARLPALSPPGPLGSVRADDICALVGHQGVHRSHQLAQFQPVPEEIAAQSNARVVQRPIRTGEDLRARVRSSWPRRARTSCRVPVLCRSSDGATGGATGSIGRERHRRTVRERAFVCVRFCT